MMTRCCSYYRADGSCFTPRLERCAAVVTVAVVFFCGSNTRTRLLTGGGDSELDAVQVHKWSIALVSAAFAIIIVIIVGIVLFSTGARTEAAETDLFELGSNAASDHKVAEVLLRSDHEIAAQTLIKLAKGNMIHNRESQETKLKKFTAMLNTFEIDEQWKKELIVEFEIALQEAAKNKNKTRTEVI